MKICVAYIAVTNGSVTTDFCTRFVTTWHEYPPGMDCDLYVLCNGGPLRTELAVMFTTLNARFFPRKNDEGWDISAYMDAAAGPCRDYDMMLCLGESIYFHREGWLKRLIEAWKKEGPGLYGVFGSNVLRTHLQTTAFFCAPSLLLTYPLRVSNHDQRYEFEHGMGCFWHHVAHRGLPVRLVTWDGEWQPGAWRFPRNIIWRGDQTNCLMWCNHSDRFRDAPKNLKISWARSIDRPFR